MSARPARGDSPESAGFPRQTLVSLLTIASATALVAWIIYSTLRAADACGGRFIYTVDDTYIHLSMARNLATSGVMGVEPGVYSSASSAPAWTALLALFYLVLPDAWMEFLPLILGTVCGLGIVAIFWREVARYMPAETTLWQATAAVLFALLLPTPLYLSSLAQNGMEHALQALLTLVFVRLALEPERQFRGQEFALAGLAAVLSLLRFECIGIIGLICLWWWWHDGRFLRALRVGSAAIGSILLFCAFNRAAGDLWLPNSVLVKATVASLAAPKGTAALQNGQAAAIVDDPGLMRMDTIRQLVEREFGRLATDPGILLLVVAGIAALLFQAKSVQRDRRRTMLAVVALGGLVGQSLVGGLLERYLAYLVVLASLAVACLYAPVLLAPRKWSVGAAAVGLVVALSGPLLFVRQTAGAVADWKGSQNIYDQALPIALFLTHAYPKVPVAVNDIGLVSYHRQGPMLDLFGLGSSEVVRAWNKGAFDSEAIDALVRAHGCKIAVLNENLYPVVTDPHAYGRPITWRRVGSWTVLGRMVTIAGRTFSFFATDESEIVPLRRALKAFEPQLSPRIAVTYD